MDTRLEAVLRQTPYWLTQGGPQADVVVASRVRLARNLAGTPFPHAMAAGPSLQLCKKAEAALADFFAEGYILDPKDLSSAETQFLVERSLASRDLVQQERPTRIFFSPDGKYGLLVNEEDHFRAQGFAPGLNLKVALATCQEITHHLDQAFELAKDSRYGWLTSCPTNTGTGMRASLLLHLPALAREKNALQKALQAARSAGLAVRGFHGEGSRTVGHLYQISNQRTLGPSCEEQWQEVHRFGLEVTRFEQEVRGKILADEVSTRTLTDDIQKAYSILRDSTRLTTAQALEALSMLRLAALGGLFGELGVAFTSEQLLTQSFQLQPGHLQARIGSEMDPVTRDCSRATLLREALGIPQG
jgi:protein arginine kinase